jgi:hypothetical protein
MKIMRIIEGDGVIFAAVGSGAGVLAPENKSVPFLMGFYEEW